MGVVLKCTGGLWALFGAFELWSLYSRTDGTQAAQTVLGIVTMFIVLLFVLPGLAVYGIGAAMNPHGRRISCPHCDEKISPRANVCPHCRRDVPEVEEAWSGSRIAWMVAIAPLVFVIVAFQVYQSSHPAQARALLQALAHNWHEVTGR